MYIRAIIFTIFLVIICVVNVTIYLRTRSLLRKYDAILDADEKNAMEARKYAFGEYTQAVKILRSMQSDRRAMFNKSLVARCMGYLQKNLYVRQKTNKTH